MAHVIITGFVQGVGFRYFIEKRAKELGLTGWVRNTEDGHVEAIFQGQKEEVDKMIAACKKGPFLTNVDDVAVSIGEAQGTFSGFTIRY